MDDQPPVALDPARTAPRPASGVAAAACLVRYSGAEAGERIDLASGELVLGRGDDADVRVDGHGISRRHAALKVDHRGVLLVDLGSANRTYVNDAPVTEPVPLKDGDLVQLASVVYRFHDPRSSDLALRTELRRLAMIDAATGALNRRAMAAAIARDAEHARRSGRALALIGCGLDQFAALSALHGAEAAAAVLKDCADLLKAQLRPGDRVSRWGGDEFALLVRDADFEQALGLAERLRVAAAEHPFEVQVVLQGRLRRVLHRQTLSIGLASLRAEMRDAQDLIATADRRLFAARREGGNRVVAVDTPRPAVRGR